MIGDKRHTETADALPVRREGLVGERDTWVEAAPRGAVDCVPVIMPERVARKGVRISFAVNLRFPGAGSSSQGQSGAKMRS